MKRCLPLLSLWLLSFPAEAASVRQDHPRILFGKGGSPGVTLEGFKKRCTEEDAYKNRCQGSLGSDDSLYPALADAAAYLVTGDAARCSDAVAMLDKVAADAPGQPDPHGFISNNGRTMAQLAGVLDWCDAALGPDQRAKIEQKIVSYADWYLANDPVDVFHDDMPNVYASVALAGLALAGSSQEAKAQQYLSAADQKWKNVLLPAMAHQGDWWHEGFVYVQPSLGSLAWYLAAWSTATDENLYSYVKSSANDLAEGYLAMHAYAWRPDNRYVYFGDTSDPKQSIELFSRWLIDMLGLPGSPLGQALSLENLAKSQPYYDYAGANGWMLALLYDKSKDAIATPRSSLPSARWLSKNAADIAILRSGWGPDDTMIYVACGDYFGAHQHLESGSFQIFRRAPLTGPTGYYDNFDSDHWQNFYSQHSVHANTLAVKQPGEFFPTVQSLGDKNASVNDGGQRGLRRDQNGTGYPSSSLQSYLTNKTSGTHYETGSLTAFESAPTHDYVACDVTAAYTSPGHETNGNKAKVSEVSRQFVFLKPDILVVFDRVESTDPSYEKRFLLHAINDVSVSSSSFSLDNGPGRLVGRSLLPAAASLDLVSGFSVDGTPHPPQSSGVETGKGNRLEVTAKNPEKRSYFLHVLRATDPSVSQAPPSQVAEDASQVTLTIDADGQNFTLVFPKQGALGGQLTVTSDAGSQVWQGPLGQGSAGAGGQGSGGQGGSAAGQGGGGPAGASGASAAGAGGAGPGAAGGKAGSGQGGAGGKGNTAGKAGQGGAAGSSAAGASAPAGEGDEGCGCRAAGARAGAGAWFGLLALPWLARRRRRH